MKRTEMLRKLDETIDRLEKELGVTKKQLRDFQEEEKQRIPKWAKPKGVPRYLTEGKYYKIIEGELTCAAFIDDKGDKIWENLLKGNHLLEGGSWELCYSDNPPEEYLKPNGLPVGEYYISIDDGWTEYRYRVGLLDGSLSIYDIAQRIYKALNAIPHDGVVRPK